jgi:cyclophilin family peptidyl-prolyl cis-trans isomerase
MQKPQIHLLLIKSKREIYNRLAGTFLNQGRTVFGEVVSGLEVTNKIACVPKDASDKPLRNMSMKIRLLN